MCFYSRSLCYLLVFSSCSPYSASFPSSSSSSLSCLCCFSFFFSLILAFFLVVLLFLVALTSRQRHSMKNGFSLPLLFAKKERDYSDVEGKKAGNKSTDKREKEEKRETERKSYKGREKAPFFASSRVLNEGKSSFRCRKKVGPEKQRQKMTDRQTDTQTDTQTDRQTDRE